MHPWLSVLFLGLGGTRIAVGALTGQGNYLRLPDVLWRRDDRFAHSITAPNAKPFCEALLHRASQLIGKAHTWGDVGEIAIGFPGPVDQGLWYSNNLSDAFRDGVALQDELRTAINACSGVSYDSPIRVVFDAQCDAGGEVYHPNGRFYSTDSRQPYGTVLNLATGVAAAFVVSGQVMIGDEAFRTAFGDAFDGGAGQVGRHLWYRPQEQRWEYHYRPNGSIPDVPGAMRMTEVLSGPAIAARALRILGECGTLPFAGWQHAGVTSEDFAQLQRALYEEPDLGRRAQHLRAGDRPFAGAVLTWVDELYRCKPDAPAPGEIARTVAYDLGAAIETWARVSAWAPFLEQIVLTGGVGIRFLASGDSSPDGGFLGRLRAALGPARRVARSCLLDSVERGLCLFAPDAMQRARPPLTNKPCLSG